MGVKNVFFYWVVVFDFCKFLFFMVIEEFGYFDLCCIFKVINIKEDCVQYWVSQGVQVLLMVKCLFGKNNVDVVEEVLVEV